MNAHQWEDGGKEKSEKWRDLEQRGDERQRRGIDECGIEYGILECGLHYIDNRISFSHHQGLIHLLRPIVHYKVVFEMPGKTLVVLGSGPGIGVSTASTFAVRGFTHVALVSRDAERLKSDQDKVLDAIQERGYSCQVKAWTCDLTDFDALKRTLKEIESFGTLECVLFNAARVAGKPPLEEKLEDIERDFRV